MLFLHTDTSIYTPVFAVCTNMFRGLQAKALHGYAWWLQCEKHLPLVEQLAHRLLKPRTHPQSALAHG